MTKEINKKGMSGCLISIITSGIIIIVIALGILGWSYYSEYRTKEKGQEVIQILDKEYGREFVLDKSNYSWQTKSYTFDVHAKDDPNLKFQYIISSLAPTGTAVGYLYMMRRADLMKQLKPYIDAISTHNFFSANPVSRWMPSSESREDDKILEELARKKVGSIDETLKYRSKNMNAFVVVSYCYDINNSNKEEIFKKVYDIIKFLRDKKKFGQVAVSIYFYKPNLWYNKSFISKGNGQVSYVFDKEIIASIGVGKDIEKIQSPNDLNNHLFKESAWRE